MPVVGSVVKVENQKGKVIEINPLLEQIKIEFNDKTIKTCLAEEVKVLAFTATAASIFTFFRNMKHFYFFS